MRRLAPVWLPHFVTAQLRCRRQLARITEDLAARYASDACTQSEAETEPGYLVDAAGRYADS